jgi:hypothetical protein
MNPMSGSFSTSNQPRPLTDARVRAEISDLDSATGYSEYLPGDPEARAHLGSQLRPMTPSAQLKTSGAGGLGWMVLGTVAIIVLMLLWIFG